MRTRPPLMLVALLVAGALLAAGCTAGCGVAAAAARGHPAPLAGTPSSPFDVGQSLRLHGDHLVYARGLLMVEHGKGRLCATGLATDPPRCGQPSIPLDSLDTKILS